jgi:hypothetical protein
MSGTATMYWMQWSRSAGLESGPCLSMMRMQASWVRMVTRAMLAAVRLRAASSRWRVTAASTAVCEWNSAGS